MVVLVTESIITNLGQNMNNEKYQNVIKIMKDSNSSVVSLAESIVNVQPMPNTLFADMLNNGKSKEWLKENNYKPVSDIGLMYVKK